MISYEQNGKNITVRLDRRIVGTIKHVPGGFQYFPSGHKVGGTVWGTIQQVKNDIEGRDED